MAPHLRPLVVRAITARGVRSGRDRVLRRDRGEPVYQDIPAEPGLDGKQTRDRCHRRQASCRQTVRVRYERSRPGELVHMDVKKLARIPDGGGWRAHGRAAGSTSRRRSTTVGYDYVHSLVDDHSRLAYSEVVADAKGVTCAGS